MKDQQIHNKPSLKENRRRLRNHGTSAEAVLWTRLKNKQLEGRKFRRQHSVENYILDFYCPSEKLAIELDGAHHFTSEGYEADEIRDAFLLQLGIRTIRFENDVLWWSIEHVLETIKENFKK
jgi:very-short-patch-repair endonuclease